MLIKTKKTELVVVDSDVDTHDLITAYFRPRNMSVRCFSDATVALRECTLSGGTWSVLLTDFNFPNISGVEFTRSLKKIVPDLPIIFITPPDSADSAVSAIENGAYDFVVKPLQFQQLQVSVERALQLRMLKEDISELRKTVKFGGGNSPKVIGRSPKFLRAFDIAKRVANSSSNILISGESGTGKEVLAKFIHNESGRHKGPLVAINCSAIPENLLESELFGHIKGAFTGAQEKRIGLFEEAQDGTLFLDEIGDLSLCLQAKLLRVIQERQIRRIGENQSRPINCRIISATHKDLSVEVKQQRFREDLFFRLNVIPIYIPALRERLEDIPLLAELFLKKFSRENGAIAKSFSKSAIKYLLENPWRGNVRELENAVERAVVLCEHSELSESDFISLKNSDESSLPSLPICNESLTTNCEGSWRPNSNILSMADEVFAVQVGRHLPSLEEVIRQYIEFAVRRNGGARDRTAKEIGIDRKTLYKKMQSSELPGPIANIQRGEFQTIHSI